MVYSSMVDIKQQTWGIFVGFRSELCLDHLAKLVTPITRAYSIDTTYYNWSYAQAPWFPDTFGGFKGYWYWFKGILKMLQKSF